MIYRKSSPQPSRLLLRIVATAGASALLGMPACSSDSAVGSAPAPVTTVSDAGEAGPCGGGFCGVMVMPHDGGDEGFVSVGSVPAPGPWDSDSAVDARSTTGGEAGMVGGGIVASPDSGDAGHPVGSDSGDTGHPPCGGVCGVVIFRPDAGLDQ